MPRKMYPAIIGVGRTKFGEYYEKEPEKLMEEAGLKSLEYAKVERKDIDACFFSDYFLQLTNKIGLEEGFMSELLELHVPMEATRSFSSALLNACNAILAGRYDLVLVGGVEKMTDRWDKIRDDLMMLEDPWSYYVGCTPEANHELLLREYVKKFKIQGEDFEKLNIALAQISVKNHFHALKNEYAQYHKKLSLEQVLNARGDSGGMLGLYDFAPVSDGGTALILANPEIAESYVKKPVYILSSYSAVDYITYPLREDRAGFIAARIAANNAFRMANISIKNVQLLELYDQSTVLEMILLEDLGFIKPGKAWQYIYHSFEDYKGYYDVNGEKLFVNLNGGLKADGNPLGATGGAQIHEIFIQLRGEAEERQVKTDGETCFGCAIELEGFGTKAYCHILGLDS